MTDSPTPADRELPAAGVDAGSAALTALLGIHVGTDLLPLVATLPAVAKVAIAEVTRRFGSLRRHVEERSADSFDTLAERCRESPERSQLLIRTIEAARVAGTEEHLRVIADSFVRGAESEDAYTVGFETMMVRCVADLEDAHIRVLRFFAISEYEVLEIMRANSSEQSEGEPLPEWLKNRSMQSISRLQLIQLLRGGDKVLDGVVADLESRGLLRKLEIGQGITSSSSAFPEWALTEFGAAVADRLREVGEDATAADQES